MHSDPFSLILLELAAIIFLGLIGRFLAAHVSQPPVLGELLIGIVVANLALLGHSSVGGWVRDLNLFSELGVILLLFVVGLQTRMDDMLKVGLNATMVAVVGVICPTILGALCGHFLLANSNFALDLFLGATLCATSVGITARVLQDLKKLETREARVILGAAVIDDVLGLIMLTVVSGIATSGRFETVPVIKVLLLSAVFIGLVILIGDKVVVWIIRHFAFLDRHKIKLLLPLTLCFALSWLASEIQLAAIVGAFAAGLIISDEYFDQHTHVRNPAQELISPLESLFAPIFFVLMGMQVDLRSFLNPSIIELALAITVAAILGKLVTGWVAGNVPSRLAVGVGMIPRGEVGLIFASVGKSIGVLNDEVFSAVVLMIVLTTLITPPALRSVLARQK